MISIEMIALQNRVAEIDNMANRLQQLKRERDAIVKRLIKDGMPLEALAEMSKVSLNEIKKVAKNVLGI